MSGKGSCKVKAGLAETLKGGVIMTVHNREQAKIAEDAGAKAVMVDEENRIDLSTLRMPSIELINNIQSAISIPVMAKCRIGHFVEAQMLEATRVRFIDESETLTKADAEHYINKHKFQIPFVCGAANLAEALRRINEGAALIRTTAFNHNNQLSDTVLQLRNIRQEIRRISNMNEDELMLASEKLAAPFHLLLQVAESKKLPVPIFASGGVTTAADVALMMQLGAESVFVSDIFRTKNDATMAKALVKAVTHCREPELLSEISLNLSTNVGSSSTSDFMIN